MANYNGSSVIVYPNADGTTGGYTYNYQDPYAYNSDPYGGTPITINTGSSAQGLSNIATSISSSFSDMMDLISKNTDKNNAWSAKQAGIQRDWQEMMQNVAMEFNAGEAAKNREWQEMMSNTAHQREIADLKAAGLNPVLSASGGNGAAVGSGASASVGVPSGAKGDTDTSANGALASLYGALISAETQMANANLAAKTNMYMADRQVEASMYGAQLAANANMYGSQMAYNASVYGSDNALTNNREQRAYDAAHPSNVWQSATSTPINNVINAGSGAFNKMLNGNNHSTSSHSSISAKKVNLGNVGIGSWLLSKLK